MLDHPGADEPRDPVKEHLDGEGIGDAAAESKEPYGQHQLLECAAYIGRCQDESCGKQGSGNYVGEGAFVDHRGSQSIRAPAGCNKAGVSGGSFFLAWAGPSG